MQKTTHYDTLGVPSNATNEQIKAAHRRLAKKHHPDKNPGDEKAAERFRKVQEAYEVLFDSAKRLEYDYNNGVKTRPVPPPPKSEPQKQTYPKSRQNFDFSAVAAIVVILIVCAGLVAALSKSNKL